MGALYPANAFDNNYLLLLILSPLVGFIFVNNHINMNAKQFGNEGGHTHIGRDHLYFIEQILDPYPWDIVGYAYILYEIRHIAPVGVNVQVPDWSMFVRQQNFMAANLRPFENPIPEAIIRSVRFRLH